MTLAIFDAFFRQSDVHHGPITTAVFDRATVIRARYGLAAFAEISVELLA